MCSSSLIISTYNWPEALHCCLQSVLHQKQLPGEVLIADDGSDDRTKAVVDDFKKQSPIPVRHIWQQDLGFRLAAVRNKAIAAASGEYIVQLDGDIILHPYFIKDHLQFARRKTFVRASRIYLNKTLSQNVLQKQIDINIFKKGLTNITSAIRLPLLWPLFETSYKNKGMERYEIHGCNMAFWKEDALLVNGYNEAFTGWGPEDKEFITRLLNAGIQKRFLKQGGIAYHIHHEENSKNRLNLNEQLLRQAIDSKITYCSLGINQYTT